MPLSETTSKILAQSGWHEGYSADLDEEQLRHMGYTLSPAARAFLTAYGGLHYYQEPGQISMTILHTRADEALRKLGTTGKTAAQEFFGVELCPLGEVGYGSDIVFMDPQGRVFGVDNQGQFNKWGDSGEEMLERACSGYPPEPVSDSDRLPIPDRVWDSAQRPLAPHARRLVIRARFNAGGADASLEKTLLELGCEVFEAARNFLTQYGGISVERQFAAQNTSLQFHTDAVEAGGKYSMERIEPWERLLNVKLCPIGEANYESYLVVMDEHGRSFVLGQSEVLYWWGDTPEELLESFCGSGGMEAVDESYRLPDKDSSL